MRTHDGPVVGTAGERPSLGAAEVLRASFARRREIASRRCFNRYDARCPPPSGPRIPWYFARPGPRCAMHSPPTRGPPLLRPVPRGSPLSRLVIHAAISSTVFERTKAGRPRHAPDTHADLPAEPAVPR